MPMDHELAPVGPRDAAQYIAQLDRSDLARYAADKSDFLDGSHYPSEEKLHDLASVTTGSQYRFGQEFQLEGQNRYFPQPDGEIEEDKVLETAEDFSRALVSSEDDPNLPIHTFRMWFTGLGLAVFGAVLGMLFVSGRVPSVLQHRLMLPLAIPTAGHLCLSVVPPAAGVYARSFL